jgi:hypothetical protein
VVPADVLDEATERRLIILIASSAKILTSELAEQSFHSSSKAAS